MEGFFFVQKWAVKSSWTAAVAGYNRRKPTWWYLVVWTLDGYASEWNSQILSTLDRPTKQPLYGHLTPITKTIQVRRTRHAGHYWISKGELMSDLLLRTPSHGRPKAGRPARTYIPQLWTIKMGSERGSERSMLAVRDDDW